jgi:hypothetical protein
VSTDLLKSRKNKPRRNHDQNDSIMSRLVLVPFVLAYAIALGQNWGVYAAAVMLAAIVKWRGPIWSRVEK